MNEGRTTAIFAAVAAVSLILAWLSKPEAISDESDLKRERTGQPVFAKFEDPSVAASFQIIKYDEALGQLERFEVAKDKASNMWKLPSYEDYPADAAEQVRDATTPLTSLPILDVPSLDRGDHALYGVVNPDEEGLTVGESGVGMLLRVKDNSDQVLAELVLGKEVDGAEGQRYVRIPTEDAVYVVELDTAPFTTDFPKWINQELLDIRSFDISGIGLRDYAILPTQQGYAMSRNFDADLSFNSTANKWRLDRYVTYESGKAVETSIPDGQELQEQPLNDLRNAVQDLEIVDVRRKPTGLAADLKADKSLMENNESLQSLVSQGFIPQENAEGGSEIFATGGETLVGTEKGVKYLLRFGEVVTELTADEVEGEEQSGLRRYLLVSATLDDSKFPPPDLEPVPQTVEEMLDAQRAEEQPSPGPLELEMQPSQSAPADASSDDASAVPTPPENAAPAELPATEEVEPTENNPAAAEAPAGSEPSNPSSGGTAQEEASRAASPDESTADEATADESASVEPASEQSASDESTAAEGGSNDELDLNDCAPLPQDESPAAEDSSSTDAPADSPADAVTETTQEQGTSASATDADTSIQEESPAADATASDASLAEKPKTQEELEEELEFVKERIAKENQRKIDERNEKLEEARKRVQELNARFADWYYVVSDSVYKKLKLSREQLFQPIGSAEGDSAESDAAGFEVPNSFNLPN